MTDSERSIYTHWRERGLPAKLALLIARNAAKRPTIEWEEVLSYPKLLQATFDRDGYRVHVIVYQEEQPPSVSFSDREPDEMSNLYANPREWFDEADEYGRRARRNDYYGYVDADDFMKWSEVYGSQRINGASKQVAYETAVAEIREWVEWVTSEDYLELTVTVDVYKDGVELGGAALGGIDLDWTNGCPGVADIERAAEETLGDYDLIGEALEEAHKNLDELKGDPQGRSLREMFDDVGERLSALHQRTLDEFGDADVWRELDLACDHFDNAHNNLKGTEDE